MNNIKNRDLFLVYLIIFISILIFAFWPRIFFSDEASSVVINPTDFSNGENDLTYRLKQSSEKIVDTYSAIVTKDKLSNLEIHDFWMIIKKIDAQGYKVWWNDELIGSYGDVKDGQANIWNSSEVFRIPTNNIKDNNELKIMMHSQYDIGINDKSIQIADENTIKKIHSTHRFFSCYITYITIGIALFSILLSAILMVLYKYNRANIIFLMCAMISMIVYSFESLEILHFSLTFLNFKRMVLIAVFINVFFTGFFVQKISKKNYSVCVGFVTLILFLVGALICNNMLEFKKFFNIALALLPLVMIVYMVALIPKVKTDDNAKIFIGGFLLICFVPVWENFANFFNSEYLLSSAYPIVMSQAAMLILIIMNENIIKNKELCEESEKKEHYFKMSIRDDLTGLYNREYWIGAIQNIELPFSVAMMDIDDFKVVNDRFGHQYGDLVIKSVSNTIKSTVRDRDFVARYGGDEFIVAISCPPDEAERVVERIRLNVENKEMKSSFDNVCLSISIGICHINTHKNIEEIINIADSAMYKAKGMGKNSVVVYQ